MKNIVYHVISDIRTRVEIVPHQGDVVFITSEIQLILESVKPCIPWTATGYESAAMLETWGKCTNISCSVSSHSVAHKLFIATAHLDPRRTPSTSKSELVSV
jgi:hypothetical protein